MNFSDQNQGYRLGKSLLGPFFSQWLGGVIRACGPAVHMRGLKHSCAAKFRDIHVKSCSGTIGHAAPKTTLNKLSFSVGCAQSRSCEWLENPGVKVRVPPPPLQYIYHFSSETVSGLDGAPS